MTINLNPDERLDDLQRNGYKLIQNTKIFCFGMDAVLLCAFTRVEKGEEVLDLGTGNGVIPILLKGRTEGKHFTGLEIQDVNVNLARRSVQYNRIEDDVLITEDGAEWLSPQIIKTVEDIEDFIARHKK